MRSTEPCTPADLQVQVRVPRARRPQNGFLGRDVPIGLFGSGRLKGRVPRVLGQPRGTRPSPDDRCQWCSSLTWSSLQVAG